MRRSARLVLAALALSLAHRVPLGRTLAMVSPQVTRHRVGHRLQWKSPARIPLLPLRAEPSTTAMPKRPVPKTSDGHLLRPRQVLVQGKAQALNATIFEVAHPQALLEFWMQSALPSSGGKSGAEEPGASSPEVAGEGSVDPFGVVLWPGARVLASLLLSPPYHSFIAGKRVLILGAGTGLEAVTAAKLGGKVIASDVSPLTLEILNWTLVSQVPDAEVSLLHFDILSDDPLPPCDVLISADCIYNRELATRLGERCIEAWSSGSAVLLADSQGFHRREFTLSLEASWAESPRPLPDLPSIMIANLTDIVGSGLFMEEDIRYNISVRMLELVAESKDQGTADGSGSAGALLGERQGLSREGGEGPIASGSM
uniref:Calmodulin-lysine N-methyltransferase n=1 Tax=Rhizochromulina marina TaxID=1034831 RepID=A0A7S2RH83_9STRA|mmetsp:Transcript_16313/g.47842  ORF Transcript_16313/g.47842 Transcript_16313/m.47842 type:complete len:371 (+) Transcript_16313:187-1299(+)|eukprot:CAMPEP_0118994618 /NCGR_PEP_ID=MMETSP1173-20130426/57081_1 /TAXON_ID=1034831 /ORGANISM="Rhizochromulina marina cf, Strain CCMP1243" /LENGTH=370 /DNA_ID=CAMNT_0006945919 /DNA_START=125 /DNA_END=1237 /DNA_ORIENTATION=-